MFLPLILAATVQFGAVVDNNVTSTAPPVPTQSYQTFRRHGGDAIRYVVYANLIAPYHYWQFVAESGHLWDATDAEVQKAAESGLGIYLNITNLPEWITAGLPIYETAERGGCMRFNAQHTNLEFDDSKWYCVRADEFWINEAEYQEFVRQLVRRYPNVRYLGTGNETNLRLFWPTGNQTKYVRLVELTREAARSVNPDIQIVGPECDDPAVLAEILRIEGGRFFDVVSFHVYPTTPERLAQMQTALGTDPRPRWITETGNSDPLALPALIRAAELAGIERLYTYRLFGGNSALTDSNGDSTQILDTAKPLRRRQVRLPATP